MHNSTEIDLLADKEAAAAAATSVAAQETKFKSANVDPSYKKDIYNILFLMFLYMLQGVPLGLLHSLPFILGSRKASYADQGTFSLAAWPYSLKLLWAPIVDSVFSRRIGRRKSWLIPVQYLIGVFMLVFSDYVHTTLESDNAGASYGGF